jgi:hypothetical protein
MKSVAGCLMFDGFGSFHYAGGAMRLQEVFLLRKIRPKLDLDSQQV